MASREIIDHALNNPVTVHYLYGDVIVSPS